MLRIKQWILGEPNKPWGYKPDDSTVFILLVSLNIYVLPGSHAESLFRCFLAARVPRPKSIFFGT